MKPAPIDAVFEEIPPGQPVPPDEIGVTGAPARDEPLRGARGKLTHNEWPAFARELSALDYRVLMSGSPARAKPPVQSLQKIREGHHQIARLMAEGVKIIEIASITGRSPSRLYTLRMDPAFIELVAYYKNIKTAAFADTQANLSTLSNTAISVLLERLEDDPDGISTNELKAIAELALDRTGNGPRSTVVNIHADRAQIIAQIKERALAERKGIVQRKED